MPRPTAQEIDALLPQTQCERCGHPGCLPYAEALAAGTDTPDQCPPGGDPLALALARLLGAEPRPLHPRHAGVRTGLVARIDPQACIGCARCLPPCPVDAILGSRRALHAVIASWCTGCELCLEACPVDCIHMQPRAPHEPPPAPGDSRDRQRAHVARAAQRSAARAAQVASLKAGPPPVAS